jgi:hypothetical protein
MTLFGIIKALIYISCFKGCQLDLSSPDQRELILNFNSSYVWSSSDKQQSEGDRQTVLHCKSTVALERWMLNTIMFHLAVKALGTGGLV